MFFGWEAEGAGPGGFLPPEQHQEDAQEGLSSRRAGFVWGLMIQLVKGTWGQGGKMGQEGWETLGRRFPSVDRDYRGERTRSIQGCKQEE